MMAMEASLDTHELGQFCDGGEPVRMIPSVLAAQYAARFMRESPTNAAATPSPEPPRTDRQLGTAPLRPPRPE